MVYSPLFRESCCSKCNTVIESEPKYPAIQTQHYTPTFISSKEKLGGAPPKTLQAYQRLKFQHRLHCAMPKEARRFRRAMLPFQLACGNMRLPRDVRERAAFLYKTSILKGELKGRDSYAMSLAAVEKACMDSGIHRKKQEEAAISALGIDYRRFIDYLIMLDVGRRTPEKAGQAYMETMTPLSDFEFPERVLMMVHAIAKQLISKGTPPRKSPRIIAAQVISTACAECGYPVDRKALAESLGISERSIRRLFGANVGDGQQRRTLAPNIVWTRRDRTALRNFVTSLLEYAKGLRDSEEQILEPEIQSTTACNVCTVPGQEGVQIAFCADSNGKQPPAAPYAMQHFDISDLFEFGLCLHCTAEKRIDIGSMRWCLACGRVHAVSYAGERVHEVFE
ncbi:MAG: hypothetical protein LVQ95_00275 [Candidatus Micrarchaeales archaeon]|nr:hypothetical protein [Candidatus Micrarchaeales archaeon]